MLALDLRCARRIGNLLDSWCGEESASAFGSQRLGVVAVSVRLFIDSGFHIDARHDRAAEMARDRRWSGCCCDL